MVELRLESDLFLTKALGHMQVKSAPRDKAWAWIESAPARSVSRSGQDRDVHCLCYTDLHRLVEIPQQLFVGAALTEGGEGMVELVRG